MIDMIGKTLSSESLTYKLISQADFEELKRLVSDESLTKPAGFLPPASDEDFNDFFRVITQFRSALSICLNGSFIGYIRALKVVALAPEYQGKSCVSIGFIIGKEYQGKGYATQAVRTVTAYLKERFDYCFADCFVENKASQRVLEKCGYRLDDQYTMFFSGLGEKTCQSYVTP